MLKNNTQYFQQTSHSFKQIVKPLFCLPLAICLILHPSLAIAQTDSTVDIATQIDAILDGEFTASEPGGAVIVVKGGKEIYRSARGMADLELNVPLKSDMAFRIGSITKQFTAAAIMMLVEEGKVAVDDEITKFLPDYPTQGTSITVRHLLNHTSGIRSYTDMPGWMATKIVNEMSVAELIDGFMNEPMDFKPGEEFRYNNSGYILLGAIIEKASGQSYAEFIQQRIFTPLQMTSSHYGDHETIIENRASGYDGTRESPENARYLDMSQPYAAGSLLSTVGDLAKWNEALFADRVVSAESLKLMLMDGKLNDESGIGYGFGLFPKDIRGHKAISHGGGIFGFLSFGVYLPDDDVYVAILCNSTFMNPDEIATRIAALSVGDPFPEFKAVELGEEVLQQFAGVYKIDEESRRYVVVKDGQLFTKRQGGRQLAATPFSETGFFYEESPSHFEFIKEGDVVTGMKMFQNGNKTAELATKVNEEIPAERKVAEIDFAVYDQYVGEYELSEGMTVSITRDGDRLMVKPDGESALEIFPDSETAFFQPDVNAEIKFVCGEDGSATKIVLNLQGNEMTGTRK